MLRVCALAAHASLLALGKHQPGHNECQKGPTACSFDAYTRQAAQTGEGFHQMNGNWPVCLYGMKAYDECSTHNCGVNTHECECVSEQKARHGIQEQKDAKFILGVTLLVIGGIFIVLST